MPLSRSFRRKILYNKHLYKAIYFETVCDGILVVFIPTIFVGKAIALLPVFWVRIIVATFLLYLGF